MALRSLCGSAGLRRDYYQAWAPRSDRPADARYSRGCQNAEISGHARFTAARRASQSAWVLASLPAPIVIPPSRPGRQRWGGSFNRALPMRLMESHAAWEAAEQSASSTRQSLADGIRHLRSAPGSLRISSWAISVRSSTGAIRWYAKRRRPRWNRSA